MRNGQSTSTERSRGQSEVIGIVLLFSILIFGAMTVVTLGGTALDDTENELSNDRAEQGLTQFASKAGLVALGEADAQRIAFGSDAFSVHSDAGWMNVTVENQTSGNTQNVMNTTLGTVQYENGNARAAYQGGGVFRANDRGGTMVSPPEFHFRNGTLTLPVVKINGEGRLGTAASVTQNGTDRLFPDGSESRANPLDNHLVRVTVHSEFYRGWGQYFEERTDGVAEYDDANETVTLILVTPIQHTEVTSPTSSLAADGDFTIEGAPSSECSDPDKIFTDSYDSRSSTGDYCDQYDNDEIGREGDIVYGGTIDFGSGSGAGGGDICGDLRAGGDVIGKESTGNDDCGDGGGGSGQPTVYGNIYHVGECDSDCEGAIANKADEDWSAQQIDDFPTASPVTFFVENQLDRLEDEGTDLDSELTGSTNTLTAGEYYADSLTLGSNEQLTLNTTDGQIDIGIREDLVMNEDATVEVEGDGNVRLFVGGEDIPSGDDHFIMDKNAAVTAPNDRATQLRLYGTGEFGATIGEGGRGDLAKFVGVIYAPSSPGGDSEVNIRGGEVFGGLLTGTTTLDAGSIHYDESLREEQVIPPDAGAVTVTFLHVTVNEIDVSAG